MIATFVNMAFIIVGSIVGLFFKSIMSKKYESAVFAAAGIMSLTIGIKMVMATEEILILALSLMLGGVVGTFLGIENKIEYFGNILKKIFSKGGDSSNFTLGFMTASILFCVGPMSIVGSFQAGTDGNYDLIYIKSVMDGFVSIIMASAYGIGVAFSSILIFLYQGLLTLLSSSIEPYVSDAVISEVTGVGGAMLLMVGLNLLGITKIKTADFIPSLFIAALFVFLFPYMSFL